METFIWEKNSTKNNSKTTSTNHEYILCYAKDINKIKDKGYFKTPKEGIEDVYKIKSEVENNPAISSKDKSFVLQERLQAYYKSNPQLKGIKHYWRVDDRLNIYRISDVSAPAGAGTYFDIVHPVTKKVCKSPAGGYRYSEETMANHLANHRIHFGIDEATVPQFKRYLDGVKTEVVKSVIRNTDEGSYDLKSLFDGKVPFNNAKPVSLIMTLLSMLPQNKNSVCLDFFAGSGTTGEAVMRLNQENHMNYKFILITNNENNICKSVTLPRLQACIRKRDYKETFGVRKIVSSIEI